MSYAVLSDKTSYEYSSYFPGNRTIDSSKFNHRSDCFIFFTQLVYLSGWYTRDFSIFYWILGSMLYLVLTRPFSLKLKHNTAHVDWRQLFMSILIYALSQLIVILWQVVDSFTVIHTLQVSGLSFDTAIRYKGIYDRGASFIQMGLIVTTTFSFVLIPLLTEAIHQRNQVLMNRYANASIKITVLISSAAGIGLINLLPLMNRVF